MDKIVTINLRLEQSGYTTEEAERYREFFEDEFEIELEIDETPAAGSAFGLMIVVKFIASAIAGGVIYDVVKGVSQRLLKVFHDRKKNKRYAPETSAIHLEFSDLVLVIGIDDRGRYSPDEYSVHENAIAKLNEILEQIVAHLAMPPLQQAGMKFLRVPVLAAQDSPAEPLVGRHWKLSAEPHTKYGFGLYYDSHDRKLFEVRET